MDDFLKKWCSEETIDRYVSNKCFEYAYGMEMGLDMSSMVSEGKLDGNVTDEHLNTIKVTVKNILRNSLKHKLNVNVDRVCDGVINDFLEYKNK